jgi:hypothetical protein
MADAQRGGSARLAICHQVRNFNSAAASVLEKLRRGLAQVKLQFSRLSVVSPNGGTNVQFFPSANHANLTMPVTF